MNQMQQDEHPKKNKFCALGRNFVASGVVEWIGVLTFTHTRQPCTESGPVKG